MINATPAYRCKVSAGNTRGYLQLGMRRFSVEVLEVSRDSFCVRLPEAIAKKVGVGKKSKLMYQEMLWSVLCTNKWIGVSNHVDLEFKQLDELILPKLRRSALLGKSTQGMSIGQTAPTLPAAMLGAFILAILIMPAWGGQWGTSDKICGLVSTTWTALSGLVTGK
ncbi:MAG: hypothetical protein NTY15_10695 [Planctomycetota bacterium]|nr:hypothetical protein [Planctomycetota bacterium]